MRIRRLTESVTVASLLCFLLLALASCSSTPSDWSNARKRDSAYSYEKSLDQHSQSGYAAQAKRRLAELKTEGEAKSERVWQRLVPHFTNVTTN